MEDDADGETGNGEASGGELRVNLVVSRDRDGPLFDLLERELGSVPKRRRAQRLKTLLLEQLARHQAGPTAQLRATNVERIPQAQDRRDQAGDVRGDHHGGAHHAHGDGHGQHDGHPNGEGGIDLSALGGGSFSMSFDG